MKASTFVTLCAAGILLTGCHTDVRSISNTSSEAARTENRMSDYYAEPTAQYQGELSEFDVLGINRNEIVTEADIQHALDTTAPLRLRQGGSILLIQSGAAFPDGGMMTALQKNFAVVPFPGVPPIRRNRMGVFTESLDAQSYSKSLRLTAARAGNDFIVCYWGMLESESEHLATKSVSWVPIVNWAIPDEVQHMRIRVKVALVDVRSGKWTTFSPEPITSKRISTSHRRDIVDQKQIEQLKQRAYEASVRDLLAQHSDLALAK